MNYYIPGGVVLRPKLDLFKFQSFFTPGYSVGLNATTTRDPDTGAPVIGYDRVISVDIEFNEETQFAFGADALSRLLQVKSKRFSLDKERIIFGAPKPTVTYPVEPQEPMADLKEYPPEPEFVPPSPVGPTLLSNLSSTVRKHREQSAMREAENNYRSRYEFWKNECGQLKAENEGREQAHLGSYQYGIFQESMLKYDNKVRDLNKELDEALTDWQDAQIVFNDLATKEANKLRSIAARIKNGEEVAYSEFYAVAHNAIPYPLLVPRQITFDCSLRQRIIYIELDFPASKNVRFFRDGKTGQKNVADKEQRNCYDFLFSAVIVRTMFDAAQQNVGPFDSIGLNAFARFKDPATGRDRRNLIASVHASADSIREIDMAYLDPRAAFTAWRGISAASLAEAIPVKPVIVFDKSDGRFVEGRDVLSDGSVQNLAEMPWEDFEHLIRQLFERKFAERGAEVKFTQSSRDRGVDAVIFDPDPLAGGKIVIQAKRYTLTVGVSAVRELYGTMIDQAATRGILVTTSDYGSDSREFAKDKNITLLNGENLLSLLNDIGHSYAIDIEEARRNRRP